MNPQVLTWAFCFLKFTEGHLIIDHQKIYPKSESKMDTKNHEKKNHFSLTMGQFLFSKYMTIKGLYISNNVCWIFDRRNLIFKNWHLSDFISTIRLELTWSMKYESWFHNKKDC